MNEFQIGDEVYMLDCIFRRCKVGRDFYGEKMLMPVDQEWENPLYRAIASHDEVIELMKDKLNELKQGA